MVLAGDLSRKKFRWLAPVTWDLPTPTSASKTSLVGLYTNSFALNCRATGPEAQRQPPIQEARHPSAEALSLRKPQVYEPIAEFGTFTQAFVPLGNSTRHAGG